MRRDEGAQFCNGGVQARRQIFSRQGGGQQRDDFVPGFGRQFCRDLAVRQHHGATLDETQRFLEHQLKAEECHDLFMALRKAVSDEGSRPKKKAKDAKL